MSSIQEEARRGRTRIRRDVPAPTPAPTPPVKLSERFTPFPTETLPRRLRALVEHGANAIGCDPANIAIPGLAALAAAIGNSRVVEIKPGYTQPAILWAVVVGESSDRKSPGFRLAVGPLYRAQSGWIADYRSSLARYKANDERGDPPRCRRIVTIDATVESVAGLLDSNPRGLLLACPELDTWFSSFTRYGNAGKSSDRSRWLQLYDGDTLIVDRKGAGMIEAPRASASVVGTIQPGILARALSPEAKESGLAARLMIAYPPSPILRWCDDSIPAEVLADYSRMIEQLLAVPLEPDDHGQPKRLPLSGEALAVWVSFLGRIHARANATISPEVRAVLGKAEGWAARLALVFAMAEGEPDPTDVREVGAEAMYAAVGLTEWFAAESERIMAKFGASVETREADSVVEMIRRAGGVVSPNELRAANRGKFANNAEARAALDAVAATGIGEWRDPPAGVRGQPVQRFHLLPEGEYRAELH